ncbi:hypothetical protein BJ166DRAFT_496731 [Pestalotiopsis sp. NC0098]|nr:hypothetical protein BJ166DRAFT_496731 [Pestalotiopsis sp. NC0098]
MNRYISRNGLARDASISVKVVMATLVIPSAERILDGPQLEVVLITAARTDYRCRSPTRVALAVQPAPGNLRLQNPITTGPLARSYISQVPGNLEQRRGHWTGPHKVKHAIHETYLTPVLVCHWAKRLKEKSLFKGLQTLRQWRACEAEPIGKKDGKEYFRMLASASCLLPSRLGHGLFQRNQINRPWSSWSPVLAIPTGTANPSLAAVSVG